MNVKMILPALTEAWSPYWRPIKYSLFPPLGLATLAGYLGADDEVTIHDEHVEGQAGPGADGGDVPDLVAIQVYITSARRAYALADAYRALGAHVALGGLHVTSRPEEAARHADTIFIGPAEEAWPRFLADFRAGRPGRVYRSRVRTLDGVPPPRRDLIRQHLYLVPNSIVVSRGCPHACDFCYKEAFFEGGRSFYTQRVDEALAEIERLPGRHLYFLDDHLFGDARLATALFEGMRGMGRLWQAAGTVQAVLRPGLMERAAEAGLRSLFVGFETLQAENLRAQHKAHNLAHDSAAAYAAAVRRLHDLGVMVNASFVFGMDGDDVGVFDQTVAWAIEQGVETATFHILTPYPGTALHRRLATEGRITTEDWDLYDTRHAVFRPARMTAGVLEEGYWRAYRDFYRWGAIWQAAGAHEGRGERLRHLAYTVGWKKLEPVWDGVIRAQRLPGMLPVLEAVLAGVGAAGRGQRMKETDDGQQPFDLSTFYPLCPRQRVRDGLVGQRPWWAWLLWGQVALVLFVSLMAYLGLLRLDTLGLPGADKVLHFLLTGGVAFFAVGWRAGRQTGAMLVGLGIVAAVEECLQALSPVRTFDMGDLAAALVGIVVAGWVGSRGIMRASAAGRDARSRWRRRWRRTRQPARRRWSR